jgi:hypothetical protein
LLPFFERAPVSTNVQRSPRYCSPVGRFKAVAGVVSDVPNPLDELPDDKISFQSPPMVALEGMHAKALKVNPCSPRPLKNLFKSAHEEW